MAQVGFSDLYYAKITHDSNGNEIYGTPAVLAKGINVNIQINAPTADLFADDGVDLSAGGTFVSGTISLNVNDLRPSVVADLFGATIDANGVVVSSAEDTCNEVAIAFRSLKGNNKYRYFWLYRVIFSDPAISLSTKNESITFNTPTIEGRIMRRNKPNAVEKHPWKIEVTEGDTGVSSATIDGWFDEVYEPDCSGTAVSLSNLIIGSISLSPAFDSDVTEYTAATSNATNTITATLNDDTAGAVITVNGDSLTNGGSASWETGENTVNITVTKGTSSKKYTVIVTKS